MREIIYTSLRNTLINVSFIYFPRRISALIQGFPNIDLRYIHASINPFDLHKYLNIQICVKYFVCAHGLVLLRIILEETTTMLKLTYSVDT